MSAADLDRVIAIAASLDQAPHWPRSAYETALDPEAQPRRIALVAEGGGRVTGFLVAAVIPPQAELESIAVSREFQRQGIARLLVGALAGELRRHTVTEIHLEVRASNHAAQAFYRSLGFKESGRRPAYYSAPPEDASLFCLDI